MEINLKWQQLWEMERIIECLKPMVSKTMQGELALQTGTKAVWEVKGVKVEFPEGNEIREEV